MMAANAAFTFREIAGSLATFNKAFGPSSRLIKSIAAATAPLRHCQFVDFSVVSGPDAGRHARRAEFAEPSSVSPSPPRRQKRGRKPGTHVAETTKTAASAIELYLNDTTHALPQSGSDLARRAADFASELGLPYSDRLEPGAGSMKDLATTMLANHRKHAGGAAPRLDGARPPYRARN
jgi:hypothetical protein